MTTTPGHRPGCAPTCTLLPARCYSCGWIGHHRHACPDHPANRVPMGETEFARLIPVGTWWARSAATFRQQEARRR